MSNPVVYIFLNKSLHMSTGKAAAQAAHAAMAVTRSLERVDKKWKTQIHRTIIVLEARDEHHMRSIAEYIRDRGFASHSIVDEGVNEIDPHTITALSTDVLDKDSDDVIKTFSTFNLYRDTVKINLEFEK